MSTYTGSELATKYAAYLIYKGTATPTQINQITSPKIGYVFDVTEAGTLVNGDIPVVAGDAVVFLAQGWTHMNNGSADQQIAQLSSQVSALIALIGDTDFSRFALKSEIPTVPTKVSAFTNDSGYLTQHQSLTAYQTKANSDAAYVGKLANMEVTAANGTIVQYIGTTTAAFKKGYFYIYQTGEGWQNIRVSDGNENGIKQTDTLGTGTEGEIVFYTGTTTADYITNNFYKYTSGEWIWVDIPNATFIYNSTTKTIDLSYGGATKQINLNTAIKDNTDDELDEESENPVQNKVVKAALDGVKTITDKLQADISGLQMQFDTNNLQLILMDSEDNVIGTANLAVLAKDAMLEDVEIYTEAETGVAITPPYLKFTFNTDAGTQPIRVPLSDFVINVTTDTELSPISTNPVQNKVIYEALELIRETINGLTATPDAQLSSTSIKPVQNRIVTGEINGLKNRVSALEGTGVQYEYMKQVSDFDTYDAEDGEIVQYVGESTAEYIHGYIYKSDIWEVPVGVRYFTYQSYTCTNEIKEPKVIIDNESYITMYGEERGCLYLVDNPQVGDKFIYQQAAILTISKIQGGVIYAIVNGVESLVDIVETKSAISVRVFDNKANQKFYMSNQSLTQGALIENNDFISFELSNRSEWLTNGYSVNDWRRIDVQPSAEGKADNIPTFSEAATRENLNGSGETTPTLWGKVKKWFSDLKDLAFLALDGANSTKFLRGDGTWQSVPTTTYSAGQGLVLNGTTFKEGSGTVAHYRKQGNKSGDYILITINSYVEWMLSFKVRIYAGYKCDEYIISGYNYGSSHWYDPQVILINNHGSNRDVKFGYTADYHVWVAIPNDNYFGCDILDVVNGYAEVSFDNLFTLQETSTLSGTTQTTITASPLAKKSEIPDVSNKVAKAGDSMSGTLTFTTANAINYNANNGNINMIRFKPGDADGHGIIIGGGGLTVIGAGESASTVAAQTSSGGSETMQVCSDANIEFYTNCQSGFSSAKKSYLDTSGNMYVNGSQVRTGTVAIANGGTGSTTRLGALQNLTSENVGTNAQYFLTITTDWAKGGYTSVADAKTVLGLGSAAYLTANSAASNSTVVQRTGSGYIYANYFNTTCAEANPSSYTSPMGLFTSNDGFIRKASAANFRTMIGACASDDSRLSNSRPASDVYAWAKASSKPSYTASEVGALSNSVKTFTGTGYSAIQVGPDNGGIVIISFAYKPTSSTVSLGVQGTYKSQVIFHAGNRDTVLDACAVFKLTTAGYIQNESGVSTSTSYYGLCVAVRAS